MKNKQLLQTGMRYCTWCNEYYVFIIIATKHVFPCHFVLMISSAMHDRAERKVDERVHCKFCFFRPDLMVLVFMSENDWWSSIPCFIAENSLSNVICNLLNTFEQRRKYLFILLLHYRNECDSSFFKHVF